jgi:glycerol-3-phosphate acyltransferase PlsY
MTDYIKYLLLIIAYLLGSVPFALIVSKAAKGIDIREYGSKNMGATNVLRVLGLKYGIITFALDATKAGIIILLFKIGVLDPAVHALWQTPLVYGLAAIIGHVFPIFARFKGGKAVACTSGIILMYSPVTLLVCAVVFFSVFFVSKYVSLGSLAAAITAFITACVLGDWVFAGFVGIMALIIITRHTENIKRLLKGKETKTIGQKK